MKTSKLVAVCHGHIISGHEFASPEEWQAWKRKLAGSAKNRNEKPPVFPQGIKLIPFTDYEKQCLKA